MMNVGVVRVAVAQRLMVVRMRMGLAGWDVWSVRMMMVLVMHVEMVVEERLVLVPVLVPLGQHEP